MNKLRKYFGIVLISIISIGILSGCLKDEKKDRVETVTMLVAAKTTVTYDWGDYNREHPIECLNATVGSDTFPLSFSGIEGFTYQKEHEYELRVSRTTLANPPADGSIWTFKLIKIISDTDKSK